MPEKLIFDIIDESEAPISQKIKRDWIDFDKKLITVQKGQVMKIPDISSTTVRTHLETLVSDKRIPNKKYLVSQAKTKEGLKFAKVYVNPQWNTETNSLNEKQQENTEEQENTELFTDEVKDDKKKQKNK